MIERVPILEHDDNYVVSSQIIDYFKNVRLILDVLVLNIYKYWIQELGKDLDKNLSNEQKADVSAFISVIEDKLYFIMVGYLYYYY